MNEKVFIAGATVAIHFIIISFIVVVDEWDGAVSHEVNEQVVQSEQHNSQRNDVMGRAALTTVGEDMQTYIVKAGDNLSKIAESVYGSSKRYKDIFEANKKMLKTPQSIRIGQRLVIP